MGHHQRWLADNTTDTSSTHNNSSNDQWRVFLGIGLLVASYVFRVEIVRFTLRIARRVLPNALVWIKEFEKNLLYPLSWVVFILLVWFCTYVMDLENVMGMKPNTVTSIITLLLGFPLIWVVICLCNYIIWGIIRVKGWNRSASNDDDDYGRVMIVTEGIGVIKILLVTTVVSSFMIDEIGNITDFDSTQISSVAVLCVELVFVLGAHSWLKNTMGGLAVLLEEQVKSGSHIRFQGHEGVVERLFLQCFSIRRYDKGLAYIPNGALLEHTIEIQSKSMNRQCVVAVHFSHDTSSASIRKFIQELDKFLLQEESMKQQQIRKKTKVLGLKKASHSGWNNRDVFEKKKLPVREEEHVHGRFWISIEAPYIVHVVYYTKEQHVKTLMAEKTEIVLYITELLTKLQLKLHDVEDKPAVHGHVTPKVNRPSHESFSRQSSLASIHGPASDPTHDWFQRRSVSDGSMLRQRRQNNDVALV